MYEVKYYIYPSPPTLLLLLPHVLTGPTNQSEYYGVQYWHSC